MIKDLLEPFLYPHNLFLLAFLVACFYYRKKGLWLLLLFYYVCGNTFIGNQVRHWYAQDLAAPDIQPNSQVVLLGCGGSENTLPACASARLNYLLSKLPPQPVNVVVTTRYCQPYVDYLLARRADLAIDCFNGGDNTYQEFQTLQQRGIGADYILSSDFHGWRVSRLIALHGFNAQLLTMPSQTFRPVNCSANCLLTVNLTNYDLYSKLIAEFSSYAVYRLTRNLTDWYLPSDE